MKEWVEVGWPCGLWWRWWGWGVVRGHVVMGRRHKLPPLPRHADCCPWGWGSRGGGGVGDVVGGLVVVRVVVVCGRRRRWRRVHITHGAVDGGDGRDVAMVRGRDGRCHRCDCGRRAFPPTHSPGGPPVVGVRCQAVVEAHLDGVHVGGSAWGRGRVAHLVLHGHVLGLRLLGVMVVVMVVMKTRLTTPASWRTNTKVKLTLIGKAQAKGN